MQSRKVQRFYVEVGNECKSKSKKLIGIKNNKRIILKNKKLALSERRVGFNNIFNLMGRYLIYIK